MFTPRINSSIETCPLRSQSPARTGAPSVAQIGDHAPAAAEQAVVLVIADENADDARVVAGMGAILVGDLHGREAQVGIVHLGRLGAAPPAQRQQVDDARRRQPLRSRQCRAGPAGQRPGRDRPADDQELAPCELSAWHHTLPRENGGRGRFHRISPPVRPRGRPELCHATFEAGYTVTASSPPTALQGVALAHYIRTTHRLSTDYAHLLNAAYLPMHTTTFAHSVGPAAFPVTELAGFLQSSSALSRRSNLLRACYDPVTAIRLF